MHQQTMTATMAYPSLPASPTLTNPDMILPYGEYDSTPSPPQHAMRPESPTEGWKSSRPGDMTFSIGLPGHMQIGMGPMTPTTPIIYGNGTMLSDIGEVTEAESTPGRKPRQAQSRPVKGHDSPYQSSPTIGYNAIRRSKPGNHHRSVSDESNSTVTTDGQAADLFKDFDDRVSIDDSNFQGDDEESIADESCYNPVEIATAKVVTKKESRLIDEEDMHSSAALSRRAEMILANAKKRLDNMEGNLTRARSSLYITPSSSMSSIHSSSPLNRSTPSPPGTERRIIAGLGVLPARHRQTNNPRASPSSIPGHMRVLSENSIPSYSPQHTVRSPRRTAFSPVGGETDNNDVIQPTYTTPPSRSSNHHVAPLEPLSEDEVTPIRDWDHGSIRASTTEPPSNIIDDHRVLTRSTSSMQMRDLTDKMKDLKGKISSLRDRAREENMKRRSLQSLRTPSPFTAAEQWYTSAKEYKNGGMSANSGIAHNPWNGEPGVAESGDGGGDGGGEKMNDYTTKEASKYQESDAPSVYESVKGEKDIEEQPAELDGQAPTSFSEYDDNYDTAGEREGAAEEDIGREAEDDEYVDELVDHDELDEYQSESDVSLYHDSLVTPISHEDREDAFDYEHFFLHSAMGTLSQQRLSRQRSVGSLDSFSSEDSVETTRGPEAPKTVGGGKPPSRAARGHIKSQPSTDSVSTLASFATATEGRRSSEVQNEEDTGDYAVQSVSAPCPERSLTDVTTKRSTFGKETKAQLPDARQSSSESNSRPSSATLTNSTQPDQLQRQSISSFTSTGTTRSFPLVNKLRADSMISDAPTLNGALAESVIRRQPSPVDMLAREDQILVEQLVASMGKCVLGLQEAGRASSEGRMWRRRLDAARKVLEGQESAT